MASWPASILLAAMKRFTAASSAAVVAAFSIAGAVACAEPELAGMVLAEQPCNEIKEPANMTAATGSVAYNRLIFLVSGQSYGLLASTAVTSPESLKARAA